jgi:hypothetical protein
MIETILLLVLVLLFVLFLLYISIKGTKLSKRSLVLTIVICLIPIVFLFLYTGSDKIKSDIARVVRNSSPKNAEEVYVVLFKKSIDDCTTVINFKDQVIPRVDCCIWMELQLCPKELSRITALKSYTKSKLNTSDSISLLHTFKDRPLWWTPQVLGDSLTKYHIKFNQDNEQTLFVGDDSTRVFLCDQAL